MSRAKYQRQWRAKNLAKVIEYHREWRRKNQHKERSYKETRRLKDLEKQDTLAGRPRPIICDICGGSSGGPGYHNGIVFDHCHQRGHFRGWLCDRCNKFLGAIEDDTDLLRKMIAYLERHKTKTAPQFTLAV